MRKLSNGTANLQWFERHNRMFDIRSFSFLQNKTFDDVNGDLRLRRVLKRAVDRERAPQGLVDAVKMRIRE